MEFSKLETDLKKSQDAEEDMRDNAREAAHFVDKRDGQWEPDIVQKLKGRPRYTDDRVNPIVDQICGEINQREFALNCRPSSNSAKKDVAETMSGLIR